MSSRKKQAQMQGRNNGVIQELGGQANSKIKKIFQTSPHRKVTAKSRSAETVD